MIATLTIEDRSVRVDLSAGVSLGLTIGEDGHHPRFFVDQAAQFQALKAGDFSGRVCHGGSCNADEVRFIPHCHGTHTEGLGHVTLARDPVDRSVNQAMYTATVVTVRPDQVNEQGSPLLPLSAFEAALDSQAIVIRTLPNDESKRWRDYSAAPPYPILSEDAMQAIAAAGIQHFLIDTPSVDAADDPSLRLHRIFWGLQDNADPAPDSRRSATITEMIFVPDHVADGRYLLHLGLSTLIGDATPSCPTLFELK